MGRLDILRVFGLFICFDGGLKEGAHCILVMALRKYVDILKAFVTDMDIIWSGHGYGFGFGFASHLDHGRLEG